MLKSSSQFSVKNTLDIAVFMDIISINYYTSINVMNVKLKVGMTGHSVVAVPILLIRNLNVLQGGRGNWTLKRKVGYASKVCSDQVETLYKL